MLRRRACNAVKTQCSKKKEQCRPGPWMTSGFTLCNGRLLGTWEQEQHLMQFSFFFLFKLRIKIFVGVVKSFNWVATSIYILFNGIAVDPNGILCAEDAGADGEAAAAAFLHDKFIQRNRRLAPRGSSGRPCRRAPRLGCSPRDARG